MIKHPISLEDPDYVSFKTNATDVLQGSDCRIRINGKLKNGTLLLLNRNALFYLDLKDDLDREDFEREDATRFFDDDYLEQVYFRDGEKYVIEDLDVLEAMPVDESFKADKEFHKTQQPYMLLNDHEFGVRNPFNGGGWRLCEWGDINDIDNSITKLVIDLNKLEFIYTNQFSCSGLYEDHEGKPYMDYGFIRFKADLDSLHYESFEKEVKALPDTEVVESFAGLELVLKPEDNHDNSLKQGWNEIHEIVKKFMNS